jgi:21S rRNA (uridine2791-2'-O)-methyltransferase
MQDLCSAALQFAEDTLKTGGHFICKFYQGSEDKQLEMELKKLFRTVHREKPESSRSVSVVAKLYDIIPNEAQESKEAYFVAMRRKKTDTDEAKLPEPSKAGEPKID